MEVDRGNLQGRSAIRDAQNLSFLVSLSNRRERASSLITEQSSKLYDILLDETLI